MRANCYAKSRLTRSRRITRSYRQFRRRNILKGSLLSWRPIALDLIRDSNNCLKGGMNDSPQDTKSRILDVAEELFSEQGLDRVSVRDITVAAKVNIASVSYHFGGKEELIAAVFARRISPVNQARVAALDELEAKAGAKSPKVEQIMEAFIRPAVE